jgi:hypothetical protein
MAGGAVGGAAIGAGVAWISGGNVQQGALSGGIIGGAIGLGVYPFMYGAMEASGLGLGGALGAGGLSALIGSSVGGVTGGLLPNLPSILQLQPGSLQLIGPTPPGQQLSPNICRP